MKLYKLSILAIALVIFSSTTSINNFNTIGRFELNETSISVMKSVRKDLKAKVKVISHDDQWMELNPDKKESVTKKNRIYKLESKFDYGYVPLKYVSYCPEVANFYLTNFYSKDSVHFENVFLKFYNNKLVSFKAQLTPEVEAYVMKRYGSAFKVDTILTPANCKHMLAANRLNDVSYRKVWNNASTNTSAKIVRGNYFEVYECENLKIEYFELSTNNYRDVIDKCETKIRIKFDRGLK